MTALNRNPDIKKLRCIRRSAACSIILARCGVSPAPRMRPPCCYVANRLTVAGLFVMNTSEAIRQAMGDYRSGQMAHLA